VNNLIISTLFVSLLFLSTSRGDTQKYTSSVKLNDTTEYTINFTNLPYKAALKIMNNGGALGSYRENITKAPSSDILDDINKNNKNETIDELKLAKDQLLLEVRSSTSKKDLPIEANNFDENIFLVTQAQGNNLNKYHQCVKKYLPIYRKLLNLTAGNMKILEYDQEENIKLFNNFLNSTRAQFGLLGEKGLLCGKHIEKYSFPVGDKMTQLKIMLTVSKISLNETKDLYKILLPAYHEKSPYMKNKLWVSMATYSLLSSNFKDNYKLDDIDSLKDFFQKNIDEMIDSDPKLCKQFFKQKICNKEKVFNLSRVIEKGINFSNGIINDKIL
jgi:hypothetical protein